MTKHKHYDTETYGGVEMNLYAVFISVLDGGYDKIRIPTTLPRERAQCPFDMRLVL
jgi:hypothetical protein